MLDANNYFETNVPLQITPQEELQIQEAKVCWLCEEPFSQDHLSGHYRGQAHNKCNLYCMRK